MICGLPAKQNISLIQTNMQDTGDRQERLFTSFQAIPLRQFALILLDSTGTLIQCNPDVAEIYHRVITSQGHRIEKETIAKNGAAAMREAFLDGCTPSDPLRRNPTDEAIELERWRTVVHRTFSMLTATQSDAAFEVL
ncbi:MAG: hypothetical protein AAFP69_08240, partial [Planctomycetota bacterium]